MDTSAYVVLSRQLGLFRQMDVIANNVANAGTDGYRSESVIFEEHLAGAGNDNRDISFTKDIATYTNTSQGEIKVTGRSLDAAIEGEGFFVVTTPLGDRYTRVGRFHTNNNGEIVNAQGYPISGGGSPIVLTTGDHSIKILENGMISVQNNGVTEERGRLDVVKFENEQMLRKIANGLYSGDVQPQEAIVGTDYTLVGGAIESSNVNATTELTRMIKISRSVSSTSGFMNDMHQMYSRAVQTIARQN